MSEYGVVVGVEGLAAAATAEVAFRVKGAVRAAGVVGVSQKDYGEAA